MKLSEKIIALRKANGMTQEELASICNVSRQSISKWEADIALPETEKLLILGETFQVSMDILLKDELALHEVKEVPVCGNNAICPDLRPAGRGNRNGVRRSELFLQQTAVGRHTDKRSTSASNGNTSSFITLILNYGHRYKCQN